MKLLLTAVPYLSKANNIAVRDLKNPRFFVVLKFSLGIFAVLL
jgi:hypothetical protein